MQLFCEQQTDQLRESTHGFSGSRRWPAGFAIENASAKQSSFTLEAAISIQQQQSRHDGQLPTQDPEALRWIAKGVARCERSHCRHHPQHTVCLLHQTPGRVRIGILARMAMLFPIHR